MFNMCEMFQPYDEFAFEGEILWTKYQMCQLLHIHVDFKANTRSGVNVKIKVMSVACKVNFRTKSGESVESVTRTENNTKRETQLETANRRQVLLINDNTSIHFMSETIMAGSTPMRSACKDICSASWSRDSM